MFFNDEEENISNDLNFFKKSSESINKTKTNNKSISPEIKNFTKNASNLENFSTYRSNGDKYLDAQRLLDNHKEKTQMNKPSTKIDLSINEIFNKTKSTGIINNSTINSNKTSRPIVITNTFNLSNNFNIKTKQEDSSIEKKIIKSTTEEKVLMKVNTPRQDFKIEAVKENNRKSSIIFNEIVEDANKKKLDEKLDLFNNIVNNGVTKDQELKAFIYSPIPKGVTLMCNLIRKNNGFDKISPKYYLYIEKNEKFLMASKKRAGNTTSNFIITLDKDDFEKDSNNTIGKLRSNFMGSEFNIFDKGKNPSQAKNYNEVRQQYGAILYESNLFSTSGPRKMKIFIPDVKENEEVKPIKPLNDNALLQNMWINNRKQNLKYFVNKMPIWSEKLNSYALSFKGRVEKTSVKNFQIIDESIKEESETIYLQFGRLSDDKFSLDFQWPFCPFQAFAIALSSLDK